MVLCESNAVCVYIAHKYGKGAEAFPSDSVALSSAHRWADFVEHYLSTPRLNPLYHAVVNRAYPPSYKKPGCPTAAEISVHKTATQAALQILDNHLETISGKFIANTEKLTFGDAAVIPWVERWYEHAVEGRYGKELEPDQFQAITDYRQRLAALPAFQAAMQ